VTRLSFARVPLALVVAAGLCAAAAPGSAAAAPTGVRHRPTPLRPHTALPLTTKTEGRIDAALRNGHGPVNVMLQLTPTPASVVAADVRGGSASHLAALRLNAFATQRSRIASLQRAVAAHFSSAATRATKLFSVNAVYDGIAVHTDASRLSALAHLAGVKAVHMLTPKHLDNTVTVPLTKAVDLWRANGGNTGAGVKIGVIDTGIDYTHADFGGAGTTDAYTAAKAIDDSTWVTAKVIGGTDFVGDNYDPSAGLPGDSDTDVSHEFPQPDPNPLDCNGHGTHVAGTAAGFGVTTGGATFAGDYTSTATDIPTFESQFSIGPGMAPSALLYALKIFGCGETGTSSDIISQALDWAAAPDGNPNHHLDVVNMSLGSDFSPPDDPDAEAATNATKAGVTVVAAAGNAGDLFNAEGAPGNVPSVLSVAASDDSQDIVDGLQVDSPPTAQDPDTANHAWPAEQSDAFAWASRPAVQGDLATIGGSAAFDAPSPSNDTDGCDALDATDAAKVAGKVALLFWTDNDGARRCGSATRSDNVTDAGAIGAVFADDEDEFTAGIVGNSSIPTMLTTQTAGAALLAALGSGTVTVTLTNALHNSVVLTHPSTVDQIASFSSRGTESNGVVKPDVTAPGVTVFSAAFGTGNAGKSLSGTSMATPHVAGEAALVLAAHPAWLTDAHTGDDSTNKGNVPLEVKAAIMNTATNAVTCHSDASATPQCSGTAESPNRVGTGRIDAEAAAQTNVIAYDSASPTSGGVSVAFGRPEVAAQNIYTIHRTVDVVNTGNTQVPAYSAAYVSSDDMPGVNITVAPVTTTPIPAGGMQQFTVTLTVDGSAIQDRPDPTLDVKPGQFDPPIERHFVADESGRLVFTSGGEPTLEVPAYAAPRHVAVMSSPSSVKFVNGVGSLPLSGSDVEDQGSGNTATVFSVVDDMELQGVSGALLPCTGGAVPPGCTRNSADRAADLEMVGATSDVPWQAEVGADPFDPNNFALANFGVVTMQPWSTPSDLNEYDVMLDLNRDGLPDAVLYNTRVPGTDVFVAETDALLQGRGGFVDGPAIDIELLNGNVDPSSTGLDTYLFDTNVMTLPVQITSLEQAGFDPSQSTRINYWVEGVSGESGIVDTIGDPLRGQTPMSIDLAQPAVYASDTSFFPFPDGCVMFCVPTLNADTTGVNLKVVETAASVEGDKPLGVLLIRHNNASHLRGEEARFATALSAKANLATAPYGYRNPVTATVTSTLGVPTGTVVALSGSTVVGVGTLSRGVAHLTLSVLSVGKHALTIRYVGDDSHTASSHSLAINVVKASTSTVLSLTGAGTVTLTATTKVLKPGSGAVSGTVSFYDNGVRFATVSTKGVARAVRRLSRGTHTLTAIYSGSATLASSRGTRTLTV